MTTCASSTGTSTPASRSCSSSSSSRKRTSRSRCSSMPRPRWRAARPAKLLFAKRAAAALGYIGLASEDRVAVSALTGRVARRRAAMRGSGRVFRLLADLSAIEPADGPTDLVAAARHAGAQLHGRGVVVLISDLLDPAADKVIRELAATGSELVVLHVLSPDELDPRARGRPAPRRRRDRRRHRRDGRPRDPRRLQGAPGGLEGRLRRPRGQAAGELRRPVVGHEPGRPDVRRAAPPARAGLADVPFTTPLALLGLLFIPAVVAMYLLKLRRDETVVPSTLLWTRLVADVEANAPWQKLRRSLLLLLQLLLVVILALLAARPFLERPAGLARDVVLVIDTSASMARHGRPAEPARGGQGGRARRAARPADRRQGQRHRRRPERPDRGQRDDRPGARPPGARRHRDRPAPHGDLGDALELAGKLAARSGDAQVLVATDGALATPADGHGRRPGQGPARRARAQEPGDRRAGGPDGAVGGHPLGLRQRRQPRPGTGRAGGSRSGATARSSRSATCCLDAQARSDVVIDDVPRDVGTLEVRLVGPRPDGRRRAPDQLAVDDRAWAIVPPDRTRADPARRAPAIRISRRRCATSRTSSCTASRRPSTARRPSARTAGRGTWSSSRATSRRRCQAPILAIAPAATSAARRGDRHARRTRASARSIPTSRSCATSTCRRPTSPRRRSSTLPDWARTVIPGPQGAPLLYAGVAGRPADRRPRLRAAPVRPAAPGRLPDPAREPDRRAARRLRGADRGGRARARRSSLSIPTGATGLAVTRPDGIGGRARARRPPAARAVTFAGTDQPGIYTVTPHLGSGGVGRRRPGGRRRRRAGAASTARRPAGAAPGAVAGRRRRSTRTPRSASRSTSSTSTSRRSRPGSAAAIEALGTDRGGVRRPGAGAGAAARRRPTRPTDPRRAVGPDRAARPRSRCASSGPSTTATALHPASGAASAPASGGRRRRRAA